MKAPEKQLTRKELIALVAMMMTLTALSIDVILPAFDNIRAEFGLAADSPATARLITVFFLGMALPQLAYGPLSDRYGRKPLLYIGISLYIAGAIGSALANSLEIMLVSRFVWGLGAAGPRVITLSVIRDSFEGDRMARIMSFIMAVFIIVPIVAPSIGAGLIAVAPWRSVFWFCVVYAAIVALWSLRLPETLKPEHRIGARPSDIAGAIRTVAKSRQTLGYTIALSLLSGVFLSYLASSERIWDDVFGRGDQFPVIFGAIAIVLGVTLLTNGLIVGRFGMRRVAHTALLSYTVFAAALLTAVILSDGNPGFWLFIVLLSLPLAAQSFLLPNFNTLALAPVGAVAGTASAVVGTVSTAGGALIGSFIDGSFDGTVMPIAIAFLITALAAVAVIRTTEHGKLTLVQEEPLLDPAAAAPPVIE
jgi:DHA1 family bicyclomycin/chloramphenicol resistance-like MFS transporter